MPRASTEFLWGAATSSHQVEGNNIHNDWWAWEQQGKIETRELSGQATDHWNLFREDLNLAQELGLNAYRFSIEWSRWEPSPGRWDSASIEWYRELIHECEKRKLKPMVTLHHFTSPLWFSESGGFLDPESPVKFLRFVKRVVSTLGDRIPLWCTFNEPMVLAVGQYLGGFMPPGYFEPEKVSQVCHSMLKAHVFAYDTIHREVRQRRGPWRYDPLEVGIANNTVDFLPDRNWHPMEWVLSKLCWRFFNCSWWEAITGGEQNFGVPGLIPKAAPVREAVGRVTSDYLGINYYTKGYLKWRALSEMQKEFPIQVQFFKSDEPKSDLGWAIHPDGLGKMIRLAKTYGLPLYITENGIADAQDRYRSQYIIEHLKEVAKEIHKGTPVKGYFHWSLLDNFEWIKGYPPRFGLLNVNYSTMQRAIRPSARNYSKIISMHRGYFNSPNLSLLSSLSF